MTRIVWLWLVVAGCANAATPDPAFGVSTDAVTLAAGRTELVMADAADVSWTSDQPAIAIVTAGADGSATITAVAKGTTTIAATMGAIARSIDVTVTDAELDRVDIIATRDVVPRGLSLQLMAVGTFSDGHTVDEAAQTTWASTDPGVATISPSGMVMAKTVGASTITATAGGLDATLRLTVSSAELTAIAIAGPSGPLPKGLEVQLAVTGTFTDASTDDITDLVAWSTTDDTIAVVDHLGLVRAVSASGSARITAMANTLEAHADITVAPAILVGIAITPSPLTIPLGTSQALVATGTYSDSTTTPLAPAWSVVGSAFTITQAGVVHAAQPGTATVRATIGTVMGSLDVLAGPAIADHLELSAGDLTLSKQQRAQLHAAVVYSDATRVDVTGSAAWTTVGATIAVAVGQLEAGTTTGPTTITATFDGKAASLVATVGATTCHVVINEVQSASASAGDEWVELYNPCTQSFAVVGWTVVYRAASTTGATDTNNLQTLAGSMAPGDLRLYVGSQFSGTTYDGTAWAPGLAAAAGAIGLRAGPKDTGALVDSVAYGNVTAGHPFVETTSAPALVAGKSVARSPFDGNDTNNGATNFTLVGTPTPRALNAP
ncbi:MAG: Ig-like domain-containing protein [Proteobacteria bacterium]|nr:Ig-like domain-containing protein [Pseudomonadota bacterium]